MDQDFNDLPLPDEEVAWQKMRELLDKDQKDKRRVLPLLFRTLSGWGLLLSVGVIVVWLLVRPERPHSDVHKINEASSSNATPRDENKKESLANGGSGSSEALGDNVKNKTVRVVKEGKVDAIIKSLEAKETKKKFPSGLAVQKNALDELKRQETIAAIDVSPKNVKSNSTVQITGPPRQGLSNPALHGRIQFDNLKGQTQINQTRKRLSVIAGLGMQQQIPIAGQSIVPYSYNGTKGSIPDYLPHLYVQLQKESKWFVEGDFRIGAAQAVNEFPYNQKTTYDTSSMNITVVTMRLKKTYYHELSSSFNYFLFPNLSFGAGGIYSRFDGAVTEQETETSNVLTLATKSVKQIIPVKHFTDSFLYRNQLRVLMQVGYQWKKFSFSLRYARDIQPYIKYTRPDGIVTEEKNQSLQFLLRFKLWQSRRF
jgi:hypothetical protein